MNYEVQSPFGLFRYKLDGNVVHVERFVAFKGFCDTAFNLADFDSHGETLCWRFTFQLWIGLFMIALAIANFLFAKNQFGIFLLLQGMLGVVSIMAYYARQFRFVRFRNKSGGPDLDVYADGHVKNNFDTFTAELTTHINRQNSR
jgi:hypothetical protein